MKTKPIIGIIGGTGQMGRLFTKVFRKYGHKVLLASRHTKLTPKELTKKSDVIIVSVPISSTVDVIKSIIPYTRKGQLLMDFTSIKIKPVKAMLNSKASVVGCHPMFGPGVINLKKQTIIMCPVRPNIHYQTIKKIYVKEKANIKISTPEKHDKMMSVIQGMVHFSSITLVHALKELGVDVKESLKYTSPVYKLRMDMIGRILNQDPELYSDIELNNPNNEKTIRSYMKNQKKLLDIITSKDKKSFVKYFNEAADYIGDFKNEAEKESNYLIQQMVKR